VPEESSAEDLRTSSSVRENATDSGREDIRFYLSERGVYILMICSIDMRCIRIHMKFSSFHRVAAIVSSRTLFINWNSGHDMNDIDIAKSATHLGV